MSGSDRKIITIPEEEYWDEDTETFVNEPGVTLVLEHSLATVSKWEMKTHLPFFSKEPKTNEQSKQYIEYMLVNDVDIDISKRLTPSIIKEIQEYIDDPMTATWFSDSKKKGPRNQRVITSEIVYFWMFSLNIPMECEHWHFNRLMTLIKVCNEESKAPEQKNKMSREEARARMEINRQRRKALKSRG